MNKKLKVAILCHFSNSEIQSKLPLKKPVREFAPWIVSTLRELERHTELEVHVISPHSNLIRDTSFIKTNIQYHFFATGIPFMHCNWPAFFSFDFITNYWSNSQKIINIIHKISPDILHLYGAENAYYSTAFLKLLHLPHLVTIQGLLYLVDSLKKDKQINRRISIEKKIYSRTKNLGIRYPYMEEELKKLNPNVAFHWHHIPANIYIPENIQKTYDIVYFAKLSKVKGIEDFIKVIGIAKLKLPKISAKVLGPADPDYLGYLKEMAHTNNCSDNIDFLGFIPTQSKLHHLVSQARICLLPVYFDTIPGTIVESMFLDTAVVSYKTGGIPTLNVVEKTVELVDQGDVDGLSEKILFLLENQEQRMHLVEKAKKLATAMFSAEKAINELVDAYFSIVDSNREKKKPLYKGLNLMLHE